MKQIVILGLICSSFFACQTKHQADVIISNANIISFEEDGPWKGSILIIKDGKIIERSSDSSILGRYNAKKVIDANGARVTPGMIDGHAHFLNYGLGLGQVDLVGTASIEEVIQRCKEHAEQYPNGWIIGRGWDQNDWATTDFPSKEDLDKVFQDRPVILSRVDGHAAWVNSKAIELSDLTSKSSVSGGEVKVKNNEPTGILIDNAIALVEQVVPKPTREDKTEALLAAQENCFQVGLTQIHDAGLDYTDVELIDSLHKSGDLKMKLYVMLSANQRNIDWVNKNGILSTPNLQVRSFKVYSDGALGSRGAWLKAPYSDDPHNIGLKLLDDKMFDKTLSTAIAQNYQVNTHCIGDSANAYVLNKYVSTLKDKNDKRWRIEHAQIVDKELDMDVFGDYSIIPSVQATHCTSDMPWAQDRLGAERIHGAYAYQTLLKQNNWLINGTDFPVEHINPLYTIYASVYRQKIDQNPQIGEGYLFDEALTLEQAFYSSTLWAAKGAFWEGSTGSLAIGNSADFIIWEEDVYQDEAADAWLNTSPSATYINGVDVLK